MSLCSLEEAADCRGDEAAGRREQDHVDASQGRRPVCLRRPSEVEPIAERFSSYARYGVPTGICRYVLRAAAVRFYGTRSLTAAQFVGTSRRSSSNQFWTRMRLAGADGEIPALSPIQLVRGCALGARNPHQIRVRFDVCPHHGLGLRRRVGRGSRSLVLREHLARSVLGRS